MTTAHTPIFIAPEWSAPETVSAASTTRLGGYSVGPFSSFNLGAHVGDDAEHVNANRRSLVQHLQLPATPQWLQQVHGDAIHYADKHTLVDSNVPVADAAWTDQPNCVLAIMTADCLPVLLASQCGQVIAAVHGGWRSLASGILQKIVATLPVPSSDLTAWLGPAIGPKHFEVGDEVRTVFVEQNPAFAGCFMASTHDSKKCYADIFAIASQCLEQSGVTRITASGLCTVSDERRFFSHRRDQGSSGRMATLIWRK
jgi:YfiH family protein